MKDIKCEYSAPIHERKPLLPKLIIGPNHILRRGFVVSPVRFMKPSVQPNKDPLNKKLEDVSNKESIPETSSVPEGNNPDQPKGDKS